MSLDLLKKLVRLATNNPNEHEANLAARRACDLLIKSDFKLLPETKPKMQEGSWSGFGGYNAPKPPSPESEKPKQEPKTTHAPYGKNPIWDLWDEVFFKQKIRDNDDLFSKHRDPFFSSPYNRVDYQPFINIQYENDKREIKCIKCGEVKETRYRGAPELWVCMDCRGKESFDKKL